MIPNPVHNTTTHPLTTLPINHIQPPPYQPPLHIHHQPFHQLPHSINPQPLIHPLILRQHALSQYQLIPRE
ncbi:ParB N-terminal domain-containing protein, partial [Neisseria sicca]|uniref:ParB N-terminal domain-containing protein n=1 Tax=Neisseria sicca TaxID=490 RepID=UPI0034D97A86